MRIVRIHDRGRPRHPAILTPAESRVAMHLARGRTNARIARELGLTENTVKTHVGRVLAKLGAPDRHALIELEVVSMPASESGLRYRCSFCRKPDHDVTYLLAGPDGVYICDACVEACNRVIAEQKVG